MKWVDWGALFTPSEKTKLAGIEDSATADQSNAEIRDAVEAATDSNTFTNADHTKLNGVDTGAKDDQTGAEIKTAYEGEADTNAYDDAAVTKLSGLVDVRDKLVFEDPVELTISAGVVTVTQTLHTIDTQNNDASDDLVTINGGEEGQLLIIRANDGARTVVLKHLSDNILISGGDFSMTDAYQIVILVHSSGYWMKSV